MAKRDGARIIEFNAIRAWAQVPDEFKRILLHNAFCPNCFDASFAEGWTLRLDGDMLVIEGECDKCGAYIARCVD